MIMTMCLLDMEKLYHLTMLFLCYNLLISWKVCQNIKFAIFTSERQKRFADTLALFRLEMKT